MEEHLPHFEQIADFLPDAYRKCKVESCFDGILKDKVSSSTMRVFEDKDGTCIARVTTNFITGFRLSQQKREAFWEQMDAQMTDGFGESFDHYPVPGAPKGWTFYL